ncbi:hypothetical protein [Eikenella sp. Marseille-P7795]|uniref:Uncharacterized protein n=1 Tax=Eikenella longinqua TaxID=1795827 RepID=A0A1A9RYP0_9NEIS|nr:hypothetical protein [Eikenella sp. Marseille-P7795]OAM29367.1 hypothetical protein A7P95_03925 [Eikenella longinqua]
MYRSFQKLLFVGCGLLAEHILLVRVALRCQGLVIVAQQRGNSLAAAFVFLKEGQQLARYRVHVFAEQALLQQMVGCRQMVFSLKRKSKQKDESGYLKSAIWMAKTSAKFAIA